jgi:amino acid transporter
MAALGEMSTYMPHPRGFAGHATRFVSDEFGVATGWNYLFKYLVVTANNVNAAALVVSYWTDLSGGIWIAIVTVLIIALNFGGPKWFGEVEFWLSLVKIITMTGLIILLLVIDLGGSPTGDRIGFRYFQDGLAFRPYPRTSGDKGRFLGFWSTMVTALFAYTGKCITPFPCTPGAIAGTMLDCQTNQEVEAKTMAMSRIAHDIWDAGRCKFLGGGGAGVEVTTRCSE